eukprot:TRINITY_DN11714_c0_g1_i10.p4 TRINITY_DN11714_c0_g1~~TRINITY_DN11714_c0_g1_i10.p4  ORF type:complete len:100 (+),score=3.03 TRINITY_DN11714_c0_g1_i10:223-522(+)
MMILDASVDDAVLVLLALDASVDDAVLVLLAAKHFFLIILYMIKRVYTWCTLYVNNIQICTQCIYIKMCLRVSMVVNQIKLILIILIYKYIASYFKSCL